MMEQQKLSVKVPCVTAKGIFPYNSSEPAPELCTAYLENLHLEINTQQQRRSTEIIPQI